MINADLKKNIRGNSPGSSFLLFARVTLVRDVQMLRRHRESETMVIKETPEVNPSDHDYIPLSSLSTSKRSEFRDMVKVNPTSTKNDQ
jgi:hypothetical protein